MRGSDHLWPHSHGPPPEMAKMTIRPGVMAVSLRHCHPVRTPAGRLSVAIPTDVVQMPSPSTCPLQSWVFLKYTCKAYITEQDQDPSFQKLSFLNAVCKM